MSQPSRYFAVPTDLLRKYDRPGPRYTSYPTVPVWTEEFGPADYEKHLANYAASDRPVSVYVHIPFCEERCTYCGCNVVIAQRQDTVERYLEYLFREIDNTAAKLGGKRRLLQLHWGGGTPTFLRIPQIDQLWNKLHTAFEFDPSAEIGIEVDPRVTSPEQLRHLGKLGFNRLSMGVQDLTPEVQVAIGRGQTVSQTEATFTLGRELGFAGINMDLVFGLPRQTLADFRRSIAQVVKWRPDRLAVYSYAHVPWVKPHQMQINEADLPTGPDKFALFATAIEQLIDAGYMPIGMDHFALPEDELAQGLDNGHLHRNFMGYTVSLSRDMVGLGVSAIGDIGGGFIQNDSRLGGYYRRLDESGWAVYRGWSLTRDDEIRREAIIAIMCRMRLDFAELDRRFGIDSESYFKDDLGHLGEFYDDGLLTRADHALVVTPLGRHFVRNIAMVFDAYLPRLTENATVKKPIFSRTV
ncbi:MAG: oxygen-independent coproporphyrinogen III oxidase [candidate division Zixibacteria bacterium]|nr:oxygen-independent coproporphyrinogen III oxidase [candidate division Zixibacteria bacterium]